MAIRGLTTSRGGDNQRSLKFEERANVADKKFLVVVTLELTCQAAGLCSKCHESGNDIIVVKRLKAKA